MTLQPSWPGVSNLTSTTSARKNLAGLIACDASGNPRAGVLAPATALVSARADMNVDIAVFRAVAVQFGGAILLSNDGVIQLPSPLVSPASGKNFYVVYAKQNESTSPGTDANNNTIVGAALSTSSFAAARGALPTGAVELGTVQMPSGKTATNASGVTITPTFQFTASADGVVGLRSQAEQDAWTPPDGAIAYRVDLAQFRFRRGGVWRTGGPLAEWHKNIAPGSPGGQALGPALATLAIDPVPYARTIRVTVQGGVFPQSNGDGGVQIVPSTGAWDGGTNVHRVSALASGYFTAISCVFYMTTLAANAALTLTMNSISTQPCGYDLHFIVEEV